MNERPAGSSREKLKRVRFKPYKQQKDYLFPPSTADYLPPDHIARMLSAIIDRIDIRQIEARYRGGGASAYNPGMLLKVWFPGFIYRIYSTRQLARAIREHVAFIWTGARMLKEIWLRLQTNSIGYSGIFKKGKR